MTARLRIHSILITLPGRPLIPKCFRAATEAVICADYIFQTLFLPRKGKHTGRLFKQMQVLLQIVHLKWMHVQTSVLKDFKG